MTEFDGRTRIVASLKVVRPGMLTTIQDLGRWGHQSSGVPVAGPMDVYSHRRANRLAGNRDDAAALEVTMVGPELQARGDVVCAVAGAEFTLTVDGQPRRHVQRVSPCRMERRFDSEIVAPARALHSPSVAGSTCRRHSAAERPAW